MAPAAQGGADGAAAELLLQGQRVSYTLRRATRRSIGLTIRHGQLEVAVPRWVSRAQAEDAVRSKAAWVLRKLAQSQVQLHQQQAAQQAFADGMQLPYLGGLLQLQCQPEPGVARGAARLEPAVADGVARLWLNFEPGTPAPELGEAAARWLQQQARQLFAQRLAHHAPAMGVQPRSLSLSAARTRWGSASADGRIRLNWRLVHAPLALIDYVVVHELAHLHEMNHSPRFWAVVAARLPDYQALRQQLRQFQAPVLQGA
ncbi:M48 family metallopeptidase [Roseateles sp. BYS180W]|uniref:M48 family metallopeptidase n=1 Tax=Roseateles rivi TaxID=3299028 RepID=A0ABW7FWY6_9BURK